MATLNEVTQEQFDQAETTIISLVRAAYPTLDLRKGTVLRDLLIRSAASIFAHDDDLRQELENQMSLITLQENEDTVDPDAVNNILANFLMTRNAGDVSSGPLLVRVDGVRDYTLPTGFLFTTLEGLQYQTTATYSIQAEPETGDIPLQTSSDGNSYFFIIPVSSVEVGANHDIVAGTAMDPVSVLFGFVSSEAVSTFSGGVDDESISQAIARMPVAISLRAMESRTSIEAKLRASFDGTAIQIQAVSSQGYGDRTQLRDKHNPTGFAVGSRVDIYTRTFAGPVITVLRKTGTRVGVNAYQIDISREDAPGFYAVRSISETEASLGTDIDFGKLPVVGSYDFTEVRAAEGVSDTFHDIDPDNELVEAAFTVFQTSTITITGVPATEETREFKVELYTAPGIVDLQDFTDGEEVRNLEADQLIRSPLVCLVGVDATIIHSAKVDIDIDQLTLDVHSYINTRSFVPQLTRAEIACILISGGAARVDLSTTGMEIQGVVRDAKGVVHTLQGDSLNLENIAEPTALLAPETTVFAAELGSIRITAISEQ